MNIVQQLSSLILSISIIGLIYKGLFHSHENLTYLKRTNEVLEKMVNEIKELQTKIKILTNGKS